MREKHFLGVHNIIWQINNSNEKLIYHIYAQA